MMKKSAGFSLIELIIFIVIMGIIVGGIIAGLMVTLNKTSSIEQQSPAVESASQCLEWYLSTRYSQGYESIACPSTTVPAVCTVPANYTIAVNVSCVSMYGSANYKQVVVTVGGKGNAVVSLIMANY